MREGVKMKKLNKVLAFALTAVLAASAFFVGCANPAGNGAGGSGDWTKMEEGTGRVDFNIDWEGDILRLSTDEGFINPAPEIKIPLAGIMLNAGEISSDRKTNRLSMESESEYVYLKKVK